MDSNEFKRVFSDLVVKSFVRHRGGWYLESRPGDQCRIGLVLFRSRWGQAFKFMLKVFINGAFGRDAGAPPRLSETGDVFRGDSQKDAAILDLESSLSDNERIELLRDLVDGVIIPFAESSRTLAGLLRNAESGEAYLLPAVEEEIRKIIERL